MKLPLMSRRNRSGPRAIWLVVTSGAVLLLVGGRTSAVRADRPLGDQSHANEQARKSSDFSCPADSCATLVAC